MDSNMVKPEKIWPSPLGLSLYNPFKCVQVLADVLYKNSYRMKDKINW